jgi:hypothetical protein
MEAGIEPTTFQAPPYVCYGKARALPTELPPPVRDLEGLTGGGGRRLMSRLPTQSRAINLRMAINYHQLETRTASRAKVTTVQIIDAPHKG